MAFLAGAAIGTSRASDDATLHLDLDLAALDCPANAAAVNRRRFALPLARQGAGATPRPQPTQGDRKRPILRPAIGFVAMASPGEAVLRCDASGVWLEVGPKTLPGVPAGIYLLHFE